MTWDRLFTSTPVNKAAALTVARSEQHHPAKQLDTRHWKAPPSLRAVPAGMPDMTGKRVGRFVVVGLWDDTGYPALVARRRALWVVRCDCGDYETRRKASILNPHNTTDRCGFCQHTRFLREVRS